MRFLARNGDPGTSTWATLSPKRRRILGLIATACMLSIALVSPVRPVAIPLVILFAFLMRIDAWTRSRGRGCGGFAGA